MKKIEKWVARDGSEFLEEGGALGREYLLDKLDKIDSLLPAHPDTTDFSNGHGYIQHKARNIEKAKNMLYELACDEWPVLSEYHLESYGFLCHLSDNSRMYPFNHLYSRLVYCMDTNLWREYGQGYFTNHPNEVEQICLNDDQ